VDIYGVSAADEAGFEWKRMGFDNNASNVANLVVGWLRMGLVYGFLDE